MSSNTKLKNMNYEGTDGLYWIIVIIFFTYALLTKLNIANSLIKIINPLNQFAYCYFVNYKL